jgi:hypothetical protein
MWGVIDAWRRPKPETFLVRNIYSPVKLTIPIPESKWAPTLPVENRHDFTSLDEVIFTWQILNTNYAGTGQATGAPHSSGTLIFSNLHSALFLIRCCGCCTII